MAAARNARPVRVCRRGRPMAFACAAAMALALVAGFAGPESVDVCLAGFGGAFPH